MHVAAYVQVCFISFRCLLYFFLDGQSSGQLKKKRICASGWFVLPVGLYLRLVCASGWFVPPVGLYFRLVCTSGWFVPPVGLYFRLVCANGK